MCRNDKTLLQYQLKIDLNQPVEIDESKFELQSVGRLSATLVKSNSPNYWSNLLWTGEGARLKPSNMILWWDLVEKYESEIETFQKKQLKEQTSKEEPVIDSKIKTKKVKKVSTVFFYVLLE